MMKIVDVALVGIQRPKAPIITLNCAGRYGRFIGIELGTPPSVPKFPIGIAGQIQGQVGVFFFSSWARKKLKKDTCHECTLQ